MKGHSNKGLNLKQLHKNLGHFFVEWWWHQIQIHQRPMSWSHRLRATGMPFAEIFQVLNAHLAEHLAKKNWLGVVSAFLMDDHH